MVIDEDRKYVLTRFYKYKTKTSRVESDHNLLILELNFKWNQKIKIDRKEVYNLRNTECQKVFTENTANNKRLIEALKNNNILSGGSKWLKELKHIDAKSFKKIRLTQGREKPCKELSDLFQQRENVKQMITNLIKSKKCNICEYVVKTLTEYCKHMKVTHNDIGTNKLIQKLDKIEERIADFQAEKNFSIIKDQVEHLIDDSDNLNCLKMWKLKKKLVGKKSVVPVAKIDRNGKLVTNSENLKALYKSTYKIVCNTEL